MQRGYELLLRQWPERHHGRHYGGALDHPDKLQAEHERMLARGYVEGPLLYVPHVVQSLGGIWKPDKGKWRTIVDATSSGVNPACLPLECVYDTLADAVAGMAPGCLLSSFDLTDAFLNWRTSSRTPTCLATATPRATTSATDFWDSAELRARPCSSAGPRAFARF